MYDPCEFITDCFHPCDFLGTAYWANWPWWGSFWHARATAEDTIIGQERIPRERDRGGQRENMQCRIRNHVSLWHLQRLRVSVSDSRTCHWDGKTAPPLLWVDPGLGGVEVMWAEHKDPWAGESRGVPLSGIYQSCTDRDNSPKTHKLESVFQLCSDRNNAIHPVYTRSEATAITKPSPSLIHPSFTNIFPIQSSRTQCISHLISTQSAPHPLGIWHKVHHALWESGTLAQCTLANWRTLSHSTVTTCLELEFGAIFRGNSILT